MDITEDIVPVICDLLNNVRASDSSGGNTEINALQQQLLRLEEIDDRFDNLSLVKEIKRLISEVISSTAATVTSDVSVSSLPLKKIESLRSQIFTAVSNYVSSLMEVEKLRQAVYYKNMSSGNIQFLMLCTPETHSSA